MSRLFIAALILAVPVAAAASPRVVLRLDCADIPVEDVRRLVELELRSQVVTEDASAPSTRIEIACKEDHAEIAVDDALTGKRLARTIDLAAIGDADVPRLLALAASELVLASWAELDANLRPVVRPVGAVPREQARRAVAPVLARTRPLDPERLRLMGFALEQALFTGAGALWGGGLQLGRDEPHRLGWVVDLEAAHGDSTQPTGTIAADLVGAGASLWLHRSWSRVSLRGGPGLRGGAARFSGTSSDPRITVGRTLWGPWLGPMASAALQVTASRRFLVGIGVELGYVVVSTEARAGGKRAVGADGPWLSVQLGIGVFP